MIETYPTVIAPQWTVTEAFAALGAILTAEKVAEASYLDLVHRHGETADTLSHLSALIRAESRLRAALNVPR